MDPNAPLHNAFKQLKPHCDSVMSNPTAENLSKLNTQIMKLKDNVAENMYIYILFPIEAHLRSGSLKGKYELQRQMVEVMKIVLTKIQMENKEPCLSYHKCLINLISDKRNPANVAEIPEELKHSIIECLTHLILNVSPAVRLLLYTKYQPRIAQSVYLGINIARTEKMRALRLAAINCVLANTLSHPRLTTDMYIHDVSLRGVGADFAAGVLPGVMQGMHQVALDSHNPGHAVVGAAIDCIARVIVLTMGDRYPPKKLEVKRSQFLQLVQQRTSTEGGTQEGQQLQESRRLRKVGKRSPEWFQVVEKKLSYVIDSISSLRTHEHFAVRQELVSLCCRILFDCTTTMQASHGTALDVVVCLQQDKYPVVSQPCFFAVERYFTSSPAAGTSGAMDQVAARLRHRLAALPRILFNIDSAAKVAALNLLCGYVSLLATSTRLSGAMAGDSVLCDAVLVAATVQPAAGILLRTAETGITSQLCSRSPWASLSLLDAAGEASLRSLCSLLGASAGAALLVDQLLEAAGGAAGAAALWVLNCIGSARKLDNEVTKNILDMYIDDSWWNLPLEVEECVVGGGVGTWEKDSVPDLYEGTIETRTTGISYAKPRERRARDPNCCQTLAECEANMLTACLLVEGVGLMALKLGEKFKPYLLKTLCLVLERVGSSYEMLHVAGQAAMHRLAAASGLRDVETLVRYNSDYFGNEVAARLKKVLVNSCDSFYAVDRSCYLQVFLSYVACLHVWFPEPQGEQEPAGHGTRVALFGETEEYERAKEKVETLMDEDEEKMVEDGASEQEGQGGQLDGDIPEKEKPPLAKHKILTLTILRRVMHFLPSRRRDEQLLALKVTSEGVRLLRQHEEELLPLVHQIWGPLVGRFHELQKPAVVRAALTTLLQLAEFSKDFIRHRTLTEVLPSLYEFINSSVSDSCRKDRGSYYRTTQAFKLQEAVLAALPLLARWLGLRGAGLRALLRAAAPYLANDQPRPLQYLAVQLFISMKSHDQGCTWSFLREFSCNDDLIQPPVVPGIPLKPYRGSPLEPPEQEFNSNMNAIFGIEEDRLIGETSEEE